MSYNRPWKPFPEQLELLKSRGMVVTDEAAALDYLQRVGVENEGVLSVAKG